MKTVALVLGLALSALPLVCAAQPRDEPESGIWTYRNPSAPLSRYSAFIVPPASVYPSLSDWGGEPPSRRQVFAATFTEAIRAEVGKSYKLVEAKGPGVALVQITLLDVQPPVPGGPPGSVQLSLHVTDSSSGMVLATLVRRRSPDAHDLPTTDAMVGEVGTEVGAAIREALDEARR